MSGMGSMVRLGAVASLVFAGCTSDSNIARYRGEVCVSDGAQTCNPGTCVWSKRFGSMSYDTAWSIVIDGGGNLFILGTFQGTLDLGGGKLESQPEIKSYFLAKFDPQGNHLWSKNLGTALKFPSVAVDASGNVVLAGGIHDKVTFGGDLLEPTSPPQLDMFVVRFDTHGNHQWSQLFGVGGVDDWGTVKVDTMGGVIISSIRDSPSHAEDVLLKLSVDGNQLWHRVWSDTIKHLRDAVPLEHAVDSAGNIFVGGQFENMLKIDDVEIAKNDLVTPFLTKFDRDGNHLWTRLLDPSGLSSPSPAADAQGNVLIAGNLSGVANLGGCALASNAESGEGYVAKFDPMGNPVWSRQIRSVHWASVVTGGSGDTIVGGSVDEGTVRDVIDQNLALDGCPLSSGAPSAFMFKLDDDGHAHRLYSLYGAAYEGVAAFDQDHNVFVTGDFEAMVDLGCGQMMTAGEGDFFIAKLAP